MSRQSNVNDIKESKIQNNITNWQSTNDPLASISDEQMDVVYELSDLVHNLFATSKETQGIGGKKNRILGPIYKSKDYIQWIGTIEKDIKREDLNEYQLYFESLSKHHLNGKTLFTCTNDIVDSLNNLNQMYNNVTEKTNYLHDLSEQLMVHQMILKDKKSMLVHKLKYFTGFNKCQESIEQLNKKVNTPKCVAILDNIDESIQYLNNHSQFKESRIYKMKYESLLVTLLNTIYEYINTVLLETTKQVIHPDSKTDITQRCDDLGSFVNSAFSLYYGKFQCVSTKVKYILNSLEEREEHNEKYKIVISDCQKNYLTQRLPILNSAVFKALNELKCKYRNDHAVLFRACSLFTMKVCQDEAKCYNYFFTKISGLFNDYLASICQYLYDILRPSLITVNHIEILGELCGILKEEMLNENVTYDEQLSKYVDVIKQLLQDVEERLVFRANVFFQHDLSGYKPSPGDLAYPEKLEQIENIALRLKDEESEIISTSTFSDSQEISHINTTQMAHFRSYTGNSPADLHGMWYPTVKRTLVCLSRLYFCLDRDTFETLAQEALVVCIRTVQNASVLISLRRTPIDGHLFQIKHLLIIREQIAPFQVDFTAKEMTLDFSPVQKAALDLIHHRNNIFTFGSNNALLEFLLEGTPKVKEYCVDSRKEIDKYLKNSCEAFILYVTQLLIGKILHWIEKAEHILKISQLEDSSQEVAISSHDFGNPNKIGEVVQESQKNIKVKLPEIQRAMQLYLANRETEFILFKPIKNNIINGFSQLNQILARGRYSSDDQLLIACPLPEQINVLICSVSLASRQENMKGTVT